MTDVLLNCKIIYFFNSSHLIAAMLSCQAEKGEDGAMCSFPFRGKCGYKTEIAETSLPFCQTSF